MQLVAIILPPVVYIAPPSVPPAEQLLDKNVDELTVNAAEV